jgi:hypothetical protein
MYNSELIIEKTYLLNFQKGLEKLHYFDYVSKKIHKGYNVLKYRKKIETTV